MQQKKFDTFIIGQLSRDINIDYEGTVRKELGGAVVAAAYAARNTGHRVGVLTKGNKNETDPMEVFPPGSEISVFPVDSRTSTSIRNQYHTADRERRTCTALSIVEPYEVSDIPEVESEIYHIAGLMYGDIGGEIIEHVSRKGKAAVDVQCLLRCVENDSMVFHDWKDKKKYLPMVTYLKTDAAEAEIITGKKEMTEAAKCLYLWGAKEIMITHHTEVMVYDGRKFYTQPLKPRNLSGRTGRGDTCFSAYITERIHIGIEEALRFSAALVSLKMEKPGPFTGTRADVEDYLEMYY